MDKEGSVPELPSGTVTFLFTAIEVSTLLLQQLDTDRYGQVLADQHRILLEAFTNRHGQEIDTRGVAFIDRQTAIVRTQPVVGIAYL